MIDGFGVSNELLDVLRQVHLTSHYIAVNQVCI